MGTSNEENQQPQNHLHPRTPAKITSPVDLTNGLTLSPRIKLHLTIHRSDASLSALDQWKLKLSLSSFLKSAFPLPISVPDDDILIFRFKDLNKRKRHDPVAVGQLYIRDLGFVVAAAKLAARANGVGVEELVKEEERKFVEWREMIAEKMDGMEVNLEGVRFRVSVSLSSRDDFELLLQDFKEPLAFRRRGDLRGSRQELGTIILRGLPSRWFAEPRVSSKPSMLVTHAIFSMLGKIRNLHVAEDDDLGKDTNTGDEELISGLQCKVVVQYEQYKEFLDALRVLCSRSLQKVGSRMKADYELTLDKDGFFRSLKYRIQERSSQNPTVGAGKHRDEAPKRTTYSVEYSPDDIRPKRIRNQY